MHKAGALKLLKKIGLVGLALNLTAFTAPQKDDLLELNGFLYGRTQARFRTTDQNKILVLKKGTRAVVKEVEHFSGTGNYGLCLEIVNATDVKAEDKCVWVYYNVKNPSMNLYSGITDSGVKKQILDAWAKDDQKVTLKKVTSPKHAQAAVTTRAVPAIAEKNVKTATTNPQPAKAISEKVIATNPNAEDIKELAKASIKGIDNLNKTLNPAMTKKEVAQSPSCPDGSCNPKVEADATCNTNNDYLESALGAILNRSAYSSFFQVPQKEIVSTSCVRKNMQMWGSGNRRVCNAKGSPVAVKSKACLSTNYIGLTTKSFNLAADCFGSLDNGTEVSKQQLALSVYSLMAQESGMHMNVVSGTGAAGAGQLTNDSIGAVNKQISRIRNELKQASQSNQNPHCSQVLAKVFEKPMSTDRQCDRIGASQENPLKNIAYSFAYQSIVRADLKRAYFKSQTYSDITKDLPPEESARLEYALAAWGHNTGPAGLKRPLGYHLKNYVRKGIILKNAEDVDKFLVDLKYWVQAKPHKANSGRIRLAETTKFYTELRSKVNKLTPELRSCLAN